MNPSYREFIGVLVVDKLGRFLFQLRDDIPNIVCPGMVSLFGGQRDGDESYLECAVREIQEELGYSVAPARFEHLTSVDGPDLEVAGGIARGELFVLRDVPVGELVVTEGSLLVVRPNSVANMKSKLTPMALLALEAVSHSN